MKYRSIALGGGGTRGGLHIGALHAVREAKGDLEFPDGIYGASVGAILGTAVAFRVDLAALNEAYNKYFTMSSFLPNPKVDDVLTAVDRKGLFSMQSVEMLIVNVFLELGIDLRGKRIRDAPQTLFIIASNMTTARPTILTGDVPILQALRCSSCVPGIFEPQVLYGDVYLDAGVHLRCLRQVIPEHTLLIHISGTCGRITPESSLADILFACYSGRATQYFGENVCRIRGVNYSLFGELTQKDRDYLFREGYLQTLTFLAKMCAEEGD